MKKTPAFCALTKTPPDPATPPPSLPLLLSWLTLAQTCLWCLMASKEFYFFFSPQNLKLVWNSPWLQLLLVWCWHFIYCSCPHLLLSRTAPIAKSEPWCTELRELTLLWSIKILHENHMFQCSPYSSILLFIWTLSNIANMSALAQFVMCSSPVSRGTIIDWASN